jgi:hypothetical protein
MTVNYRLHEQRARRAWPHLVRHANGHKSPFTYGEISARVGVHWRAASWFLGVIQEYCRNRGWPPLQALAVNARTKIPGDGYVGSARTKPAHAAALKRVYRKKNWPLKAPF